MKSPFEAELAAVENLETFLVSPEQTPQSIRHELEGLLKDHKKLIKQSKRLLKISDRNEASLRDSGKIIEDQRLQLSQANDQLEQTVQDRTASLAKAQDQLEKLVKFGLSMTAERNHDRLMELILFGAKDLTNADGGTLYIRTPDDTLEFKIVQTESLNIAMGGTSGQDITFPAVPMFDKKTQEPNHHNIVTHVALTGKTVMIADAYQEDGFDFSGTKAFDVSTGYRSTSFLTIPLKTSQGDVIGVVQLINARDVKGQVIAFDDDLKSFIEALASQSAVALDNHQLTIAQKELFDAIVKLTATAIDAKSEYTGGHCERVPLIGNLLAEAACASDEGIFADFDFNEDEWREFEIAGWLHDCGKVTTPEYVVDKATKLETIYNRIHEIRMRFEVLLRDVEIDSLKQQLAHPENAESLKAELAAKQSSIQDDFEFIATCNVGGEFMSDDKIERLEQIAERNWTRHFDDRLGLSHMELIALENVPQTPTPSSEQVLMNKAEHITARSGRDLNPFGENKHGFKMDIPKNMNNKGELYNLCFRKGTLNDEERFKINDHMVQTINMLGELPFPKYLARVPEYAGGHHETMDGKGYPKKLSRDEMSLPARILAIADIFEALTAADRPYKQPKTLSEAIRIMSFMRNDNHIDPDLFDLFLTSGVPQEYGDRFLKPDQIDDLNINDFLNSKT